MIKYILRKPLFSVLLLIIIVFDVLFLGILHRGIERDMQTVEEMYDNAEIIFDVIPFGDDSTNLSMRPHYNDRIEKIEEVDKIYRAMYCPCVIKDNDEAIAFSSFYGTNDALWFIESNNLEVTWAEGFYPETGEAADWTQNDGMIPCIADEALLKEKGLTTGDTFTACPDLGDNVQTEKTPLVTLYIIGTILGGSESLKSNALIVPEALFLSAPSILYNWKFMDKYCAFNQFRVLIKKEYNRQVDEVEEKMVSALSSTGLIVHSDARALKKAVRPIEKRLKIQKALQGPMEIALSLATALLAVLLALSVQDDIFLFLLHGIKRRKAALKILLNLSGIIFGAGVFAGIIGVTVLGSGMMLWVLKYLIQNMLICVTACAVPVALFCMRNLVHFYQTKEG